ncbi:hypothetical protein HDU78_000012 [Chytriomyces hyalinus]|nr:hypothetical protein HDU78_000012 [Chytriomyces hyalinus]
MPIQHMGQILVIAVGMSRFTRRGMTARQVAHALSDVHQTSLSLDDLAQLHFLVPSAADVAVLEHEWQQRMHATKHAPAQAELFAMELLAGERDLAAHVRALLFIQTLKSDHAAIDSQLRTMIDMCSLLQTNDSLKSVLRSVVQLSRLPDRHLSEGNTSFRPWMGRATHQLGFKLKSMTQIQDVKSHDGKWNLLNFLVDLVAKNNKQALNVATELAQLKEICNFDLHHMAAQWNILDTTYKTIKSHPYRNQSFAEDLATQLEDASTTIAKLKARFYEFEIAWRSCALYFAEDTSEYTSITSLFAAVSEHPDPYYNEKHKRDTLTLLGNHPEPMTHLFSLLYTFLASFETAVRENREKMKIEAKKLAREASAFFKKQISASKRVVQCATPDSAKDLSLNQEHAASSDIADNDSNLNFALPPKRVLRKRASTILTSMKEFEAPEMVRRFTLMSKTSSVVSLEVWDESYWAQENDDVNASEASYHASEDESWLTEDEDDWQEEETTDADGKTTTVYESEWTSYEGNVCSECCIPANECYCNW